MSADNIVHMAEIKQDNTLITPVGALEDAIRMVKREHDDGGDEDFKTDGVIIMRVMRTPKSSHFSWSMSNVKASEAISFLERLKADFIRMMDGCQ